MIYLWRWNKERGKERRKEERREMEREITASQEYYIESAFHCCENKLPEKTNLEEGLIKLRFQAMVTGHVTLNQ